MSEQVQNGQISAIADDYVPPEPAIDFEEAEPEVAETPPELPTKTKRRIATTPPALAQKAKDEPEPELEDPGDEDDTVDDLPVKAEKESVEPKYDARLVARAREYDFSDDEIAEYSPAQLAKAVAREDRRLAEQFRKQKAEPKVEVKKPDEKKDDDPFKLDIDESFFDEAKYDPEVSRAFKSLKSFAEKLGERDKQRQATLDSIVTRNQKQEFDAVMKRLDNWFNDHGDPALVGEGASRTLKRDSAESFGRGKVFAEMDKIRDGYIASGRTPPEHEDLAKIAYVIAHGVAPLEKVEEDKPRGRDLSQHDRRPDGTLKPLKVTTTTRPGNREVPKQKGDKAALAGIAQMIGIAGNHATATDGEVEDSLL